MFLIYDKTTFQFIQKIYIYICIFFTSLRIVSRPIGFAMGFSTNTIVKIGKVRKERNIGKVENIGKVGKEGYIRKAG